MLKGSCLCGAVRFEIAKPPEQPADACHCSQCRKQTSHLFVSINVPRSALTVHGAERVSWYHSSAKVRRGFCAACGSALFWDPIGASHGLTSVAMGALEQPTGLRLGKHIFVADKGDYYEIGDGRPQHAGH